MGAHDPPLCPGRLEKCLGAVRMCWPELPPKSPLVRLISASTVDGSSKAEYISAEQLPCSFSLATPRAESLTILRPPASIHSAVNSFARRERNGGHF